MVREGISAYRAGRREEAHALLMRAVEIDQYNEQAWLWLSAVVESVDEQRTCLENVLTINPGNERAKQGLQMLTQKGGTGAKSAPTQAEDVLANSSFTPSLPKTNPFNLDAAEELPPALDLGADEPPTASSSASSTRRVLEPSKQEYDDWVSNLGLGGNKAATPDSLQQAANQVLSIPDHPEEEDDLFNFGGQSDSADDLFTSGPFGAATTPLPGLAEVPAAAPVPASKAGKKSDDLLSSLDDDDAEEVDFTEAFEDGELDKLEAAEFFRYIPREITATRLPGTREGSAVLVLLGLVVALALNAGAVAFLVMRLTG
jgi:hypothetical protein